MRPAWEQAEHCVNVQPAWPPNQCWAVSSVVWDTHLVRIIRAGLETAGGDNLLLVHNPGGKGVRSVAQEGVWAVVGPLRGQDDSAATHPDQGDVQEVCWELVQQLLARIMFARQRKCRSMIDLLTI
jgi:hypothetical protein